jgi:endo-1,3-1,4-beta-glycanase ExoK
MLLVGTAWGQGITFLDDFGYFDTTRWSKGDHMLGRSYLDPANVDVDGQNLRIKLPARTLEGGEVLTNELHGYGSYSARMKLPNTPGSITGFFLYKAPDYESEIDVEIYNDSTRRIMFTTYAGGRQTHTQTVSLPFDPTAGFHEYGFDYLNDPGTDQASVTFYVDGVKMSSWDTGVPQTSMHLMLNSWFPSWLDGKRPKKATYTYVDSIDYAVQP